MEAPEQSTAIARRSYATTRPIIPLTSERSSLDIPINDALTVQLRPLRADDIEFIHRLRTQEVVMARTSKGSIDLSIAESQQWMDRFLPPNDDQTYNLMIWIKNHQKRWEHIGSIGSHIMRPVPHVGYMIRSEWWGKSIVTKTLRAFLKHWWSLPRKVVDIIIDEYQDEDDQRFVSLEINSPSLGDQANAALPEIILAEIEHDNIGSVQVVTRCGFACRSEKRIQWKGTEITLLTYTLSRPQS